MNSFKQEKKKVLHCNIFTIILWHCPVIEHWLCNRNVLGSQSTQLWMSCRQHAGVGKELATLPHYPALSNFLYEHAPISTWIWPTLT